MIWDSVRSYYKPVLLVLKAKPNLNVMLTKPNPNGMLAKPNPNLAIGSVYLVDDIRKHNIPVHLMQMVLNDCLPP